MPEAVLFDLDGTLADTAPDLGGALNQLLKEQGRGPLPMAQLRPHVSSGARGMIGAGLGVTPADPAYFALQQRFLAIYQDALCRFEALLKRMNEVAPECPKCGASKSDKMLSAFAVTRGSRKSPPGACGSTDCAGCRH
jgi:phosphoglycolate phosphatase-like HAD superfamily hydrolase